MGYVQVPPSSGGGGGGGLTGVSDTTSINLSDTLGIVSGVVRLSAAAASVGNTIVGLNIQPDGIRAQIANASVQSLISGTSPISVTAGVVSIQNASTSLTGALTSTDWNTFNAKVSSTRSISTTAPLTGGGDLSADRTLSIPASTAAVDGYLAAADFTTFAAKVGPTRSISTTAPLSGGGNLSADRTLSISQSTTTTDGFLSSTDWNSFNSRITNTRTISTTAPLQGGGNLSADRTLSILNASTSVTGALTSTDWNTFNGKVSPSRLINTTGPLVGGGDLSADLTISIPQASGTTSGFLTNTDWNTFNLKSNTILITAPGAGNANGLTVSGSSLTLHAATATLPGIVTTAAQTFAGVKTFNSGPLILNNVTNLSYVSGLRQASAFTSVANLLTSTMTFDATLNMFTFQIQVGSGQAIICFANFLSAGVTCYSDPSNIFLPTDAGVGIVVTKPASSRVITVRTRIGSTQLIGIQIIAGALASATVWA
jgi:hypothetical protein